MIIRMMMHTMHVECIVLLYIIISNSLEFFLNATFSKFLMSNLFIIGFTKIIAAFLCWLKLLICSVISVWSCPCSLSCPSLPLCVFVVLLFEGLIV